MKQSYKCKKCDFEFPDELVQQIEIKGKAYCEKCGTTFSIIGKKIFLSATSEFTFLMENLNHQLLSLGFKPIWYQEDFPIEDKDAIKECFKNVNETDRFILIIGKKYGSLHESGLSVIEKEFHLAYNNNKPILVFIESEVLFEYDKLNKLLDISADPKVYEFIEKIKSKRCWISKFDYAGDILKVIKNKWGVPEKHVKLDLAPRSNYDDVMRINVTKPKYYQMLDFQTINEFIKTIGIKKFDNEILKKQKWSLFLPSPINLDDRPSEWINQFQQQFSPLLEEPEGKEWLKERILKLAYGNRGIQRYDLLDSILAVPPLESVIAPIQRELAVKSGKAGLFSKTGMGKSRTLLYLSHWWIITNPNSTVLLIDHPLMLSEELWNQLKKILDVHQARSPDEKLLLIIDDIHLAINEKYIQNIITAAGPDSYKLLVAFTEEEKTKFSEDKLIVRKKYLWLKENLLPLGYTDIPNLTNSWSDWREYLYEWIRWVAEIVLDPYSLTSWKSKFREEIKEHIIARYDSPWSFVITLGFLQKTLEKFLEEYKNIIIQRLLYGLIGLLFLKTGEIGVAQSQLLKFLRNFIDPDELQSELGENWEYSIMTIIEFWTNPPRRLLPPFKRRVVTEKIIETELVIDFYHREWAISVCNILLESRSSDLYDVIHRLFKRSLPQVYKIWNDLSHTLDNFPDFIEWFRDYVELYLDSKGTCNVISLDLSNYQLEVLPQSLIEMKNLEKLYLENNRLKSLPDSITKLSNLMELNLNNNQLISLPDSICEMVNLQILHLENNSLPFLPKNIGNLSNLKKLWVVKNNLKSLPKNLGNLKNLKELWINHNQLEFLPKSLGDLTNLRIMSADSNELNFLPSTIKNLKNLTLLNLGGNKFSKFPNSVCGLPNLTELYIGYNLLTSVPKNIGNLTNLKILEMYNNEIESIPKSLDQLSDIEELDLGFNFISSLPDNLGNLVNLKNLELYSNRLTSIPESIGNLENLQVLNLSDNQLIYLPKNLGNMKGLNELNLTNNHLYYLPESIIQLKNLEKLSISCNPSIELPLLVKNSAKFKKIIVDLEDTPITSGISEKISLSEMFQKITPEVFKPKKAIKFKGLIQFIIEGDQPQAVYIDKGTIKIKNEIGKNPYCTIIIDKNLLLAILRGMIHARIAFSKGGINISKKRAIIKMWRIFDLDAIPRKVREMEKNAGFRYSDEKITIHEIFQNMKNVFLPKKARGWKGIIQFDIPNEPYAIYVNNGEVTIKPERAPTHNLLITIEEDDLRDLATGYLDLKIGAITGLIIVDNIPVGLKFIKMFKIQDLPFTFKRSQLRAKNRVKKTVLG